MSGGMQTLPPTQAPSSVEYGGDEISALVLDPGCAWTRAGFAGEDTPKCVIPSSYGAIGGKEDSKPELVFGDNGINAIRPGMEIKNPMSDGIVADWDVAPQLWRHALTSRLASNLSEHPLLMTEPAWNPPKNREKTMEIAFEDFDVPAFYLAKSAVCASFASGKATCLLIDIGASNVSVTPIHDGFVLRKGVTRTPLGGDFLSNQIRTYLASINVPISAHYQILSKTAVDVGKPAEAVLRQFAPGQEPTASYKTYQEERVLTQFKECAAQVWNGPGPLPPATTPGAADQSFNFGGGRTFEFPDGYNLVFGSERFRITEGIFTPRNMLTHPDIPHPDPETTMGIGSIMASALKDVDIELKGQILNNVLVTGGASLLMGLTDRVNSELGVAFPGPRLRITATGNPVERKYAGWLGGSILASLGSFHQLWVSRKEYDEHGPGIVEKRCK
ncbi:Actin/actin-like protein [Ascodesmis nigricans]|uniref:Actin/actin-like protein n=1 Tax=Ascodesmis nigricans TaxID=341454 RepID=A0A4S2N2B2_9PEZI|nr:Actin/actin-like protein [Ascodesmis nigricans]